MLFFFFSFLSCSHKWSGSAVICLWRLAHPFLGWRVLVQEVQSSSSPHVAGYGSRQICKLWDQLGFSRLFPQRPQPWPWTRVPVAFACPHARITALPAASPQAGWQPSRSPPEVSWNQWISTKHFSLHKSGFSDQNTSCDRKIPQMLVWDCLLYPTCTMCLLCYLGGDIEPDFCRGQGAVVVFPSLFLHVYPIH